MGEINRDIFDRGDSNKHDSDKPMWDLLPLHAISHMVNVLTKAVTRKGYGKRSWRNVENARERYTAAMYRHLYAYYGLGEIIDPEFDEPHMAHILCNAAFLCELDETGYVEDR